MSFKKFFRSTLKIRSGATGIAAVSVFFLILSLVVFRKVIPPDTTLLTTDDGIGALALLRYAMPGSFLGGWNDNVMAGLPQISHLNLTSILLWLFSPQFFSDWIHAIDLTLASVFLCLFLRSKGLGLLAGVAGALAAFWLGSNFTLTYAGHIGKFGVLVWAPASLWFFEKAKTKSSFLWAVLCGFAVSMMFLEQADVALFFCVALFPYFLFSALRFHSLRWRPLLKTLCPIPAMLLIMAAPPLLSMFRGGITDTQVAAEDPRAQWEFATQWSWPPEESIDFIAPGYMGWRSGETAGPYYGRMGRSHEWEQTRQGFMNFKLENQYLGALALLLALFAGGAAWITRKQRRDAAFEIAFWSIACIVTLLLSFGKYFPLYRLFYQLPVVSSIRNPNKFLQIFQLCVGILCAYGVYFSMGGARAVWKQQKNRAILIRVVTGFFVFVGIFAFFALVAVFSQDSTTARFVAEGWGAAAAMIVRNRIWALWHAVAVMLASGIIISIACIYTGRAKGVARVAAAFAVIAVMTADILFIAQRYIKPFPMEHVVRNELIDVIKTELGPNRTAFAMVGGGANQLYTHWLTYLWPYHGIKTVNVTQMPRMPLDYATFFGRVGSAPFRLWQQFGVTLVVAPAQVWADIQNNPQFGDVAQLIFAFNVRQKPDGVFQVIPGTAENPGMHCLLRLKVPSTRFLMAHAWRTVSDNEALDLIVSDRFSPMLTVLVAEQTAGNLPPSEADPGCDFSINVQHDRPGYVSARVFVKQPCVLRFAENYNPDWKVRVNGEEADLLRVDYLFQGVFLNIGVHNVEFIYSPSRLPFATQALGWLIGLGAAAGLLLKSGKKPA